MAKLLGVAKTLEVIEDVKNISVSVITIVKAGGFSWGSMDDFIKVAKYGAELVKDIPGVLPELKDLEPSEAGAIGVAAYDLFKSVIDGIIKK